jgi:hypothetical protein
MLTEFALYALSWLTSPRVPHAVRRDAIGLWARRRRCRSDWAEHEARTRTAIRTTGAEATGRRKAVVLGSGLLADVPIDWLCEEFQQVVLVDICHLPQVRLRVLLSRHRFKVKFLRLDLSGYDKFIEQTRIKLSTGQDDLGVRLDPLAAIRRMRDVDFVVSANLLSQIAVGAEARYRSKKNGHANILPDDTVAQLVAGHVDSLASMPCRTCLVTDIDYERRDRQGEVFERVDLLRGVGLPEPFDAWSWPVAPFGEESADSERVHHVVAVDDVAVEL